MSSLAVTGGEARDQRWWPKDEKGDPIQPAHDAIFSIVNRIKENQSARTDRDLIHYCLYGADLVQGFGVTSYTTQAAYASAPLSVNIVRSVIDTLLAKIVKGKPRPFWLTSGGDWDLQQQAKQLNKYSEGQFYENKVYRLNRKVVRDALIFGTGGVRGHDNDGQPTLERTFTPECYVADADAKYGDPRCLYQQRTMDKLVLTEKFPKFAAEIDRAGWDDRGRWTAGDMVPSDQVEVCEAWHLPSGEGASDGRDAIVIPGATLQFGDSTGFQHRFLRYCEPVLGWYGSGLAQLLAGKQLEINKLLMEIQRSFHVGSNFRVLCERGSKILKSHFNNEIGGILEYTGAAPTFAVAQTVHPEKFQHLLWLVDASFREAGINAMTAAGQKDPTLKSGKAQEVALDIEDSRYADFAQAYEEFCMDEAELLLDMAKRSGRKPVIYVGKRETEEVELPDMKRQPTVLQVFPTSALASAPAQRMQQVQDLAGAGWITPAEGKRLLDFPELEEAAEMGDASYNNVRECLARMLTDGEYQGPLPQMDLDEALETSVDFYLWARNKYRKSPPANLDLILQFQADVEELMNAGKSAGQDPQLSGMSPVVGAPVPGGTPGGPAPPPQGPPPGSVLQ
ncbi:MAG: hypothetical protein V4529_16460 [Gemmatimonadota bacterium]